MKKKAINISIALLIIIAATCGFLFARELWTAQEEISEYADIQEEYTVTVVAPAPVNEEDMPSPDTTGLPYAEADFDALLLKNPDTVGWVVIPGTPVNYPVVQGHDNTKYLNIAFDGKRSGAGTPFADKDNDMRNLDANTVVYGHNMGRGRTDMFGSLLAYKDYKYYLAHRYIQFDTVYQRHGWWKVFAVMEYDVRSDELNPLQLRFDSDSDFMEWISQAGALSLHETDIAIAPQDRILTLSTCDRSRYGKNGRLLILAVKMNGIE